MQCTSWPRAGPAGGGGEWGWGGEGESGGGESERESGLRRWVERVGVRVGGWR